MRQSRAVGLGLRRERARLELDFTSCQTTEGADVECSIELVAVDNARETVKPGNVISGVLAASHPHGWFNGMWFRPGAGLMRRAVFGLTGTAGAVQSRLIPNPLGAGIVMASKAAVLRMPDPEIRLPAGTDLVVRVSGATVEATEPETDEEETDQPVVAHDSLAQASATIRRGNGEPVTDLINLAFIGSAEEISAAFQAAGWVTADANRVRAVARAYGAYASMKSYETAPVSPLYHEDRLPDSVFQKSFQFIFKRHHIRNLNSSDPATPYFLGAPTPRHLEIPRKLDRACQIPHENLSQKSIREPEQKFPNNFPEKPGFFKGSE